MYVWTWLLLPPPQASATCVLVSSYYYMCECHMCESVLILLYVCWLLHASMYVWTWQALSAARERYCCMCPHTTLCPHTTMCHHTTICVRILLYMCPGSLHRTQVTRRREPICVLILLFIYRPPICYVSSVLVLVFMCPIRQALSAASKRPVAASRAA